MKTTRRRISSGYYPPFWYHIFGVFSDKWPAGLISCEVEFGTPDGRTTEKFGLFSYAKEAVDEFIDNLPADRPIIVTPRAVMPVITYTPYCRTCGVNESFTDPDAAAKFLLNHSGHRTILEIK